MPRDLSASKTDGVTIDLDAASEAIAVLGSSTQVGAAVLNELAQSFDRPLIAVSPTTPAMIPPRVEVRTMDARDRLLPLVLDQVGVVVHCAFSTDLSASADALYGANVGGTRNVLSAIAGADVSHLVVLSSATVYGAHPDNPLPLTEAAPLRANPGFAYAYQRALIEQMLDEWQDAHPEVTVTRLRLAPVLGHMADGAQAARLLGPRLIVPAGSTAPWQFLDVADAARAVAHCIAGGLGGIFNVAADGWLSTEEVAVAVGRPVMLLGQSTLGELLSRASHVNLSPAPAQVMPYLQHPWVLDAARLRRTGWTPQRTNTEMLESFGQTHRDVVALGTLRLSRRRLWQMIIVGTALSTALFWKVGRLWKARR